MRRRVQGQIHKPNIPITTTITNSSLVAKKPTVQTIKAPQSKRIDPKFNFNLNNISSSSPQRVQRIKPNFSLQGGLVGQSQMRSHFIHPYRPLVSISPLKSKTIRRNPNGVTLNQSATTVEKPPETNQSRDRTELATGKQEQNQPQSPTNPPSNKQEVGKASGEQSAKTEAKETGTNQKTPEGKSPGKTITPSTGKTEGNTALGTDSGTMAVGEAQGANVAIDDPGFQSVVTKSGEVAKHQKQHQPSTKAAQEAQLAAVAPPNERESKAENKQVGKMAGARTPGFNGAAFKAKLMQRIREMTPKNLEEADNFKKNNKLNAVKGELSGQVNQEKQKSQGDLEQKTKEKPDSSGIEQKEVSPLPPQEPGTEPGDINAEQAVPKPKDKKQVEAPLENRSKGLDQKLVGDNITEKQLAKSNEPQFLQTLEAKKTAQTHAKEAPKAYRQSEKNQLNQAQGEAAVIAQEKLQGMHGDRLELLQQVTGNQLETKSNDEQERTKIAGDINAIYDDTKGKVERTLSKLDQDVGKEFDRAAATGKQSFENYVDHKMRAYKDRRYGGAFGWARWIGDKLFGMPSEVNRFYEAGRRLYIQEMDRAINKIVNLIGNGLTKAKNEIANGKQKIQNYVQQLPQNLQGIGSEAAEEIRSNFEELEQTVDDKQNDLIDTLAEKYNENLEAIDARIEEMKEANKGLVQKAIDFVVDTIDTIIKMGKLLAQVLAKAISVIPDILKDPIGFVGNLFSALKQGFQNFVDNIGKHLQDGLMSWLAGPMAAAEGLKIPEKLTPKTIGEIAKIVAESIIQPGIIWLMSLLNPATAFIKACQAIVEIMKFFIERIEQIADFFNSIIDAVIAIAKGQIDKAIKGVENALAKSIPLIIAFLSGLLGVGVAKIARKVKKIIFGKGKKRRKKGKKDKDDDKSKNQNHKKFIKSAVIELEKTDGKAKDYETLKEEKEKQAEKVEKLYTNKLKKNKDKRKLKVDFEKDSAKAREDNELDFKVEIIRMQPEGEGAVPIQEGDQKGLDGEDHEWTGENEEVWPSLDDIDGEPQALEVKDEALKEIFKNELLQKENLRSTQAQKAFDNWYQAKILTRSGFKNLIKEIEKIKERKKITSKERGSKRPDRETNKRRSMGPLNRMIQRSSFTGGTDSGPKDYTGSNQKPYKQVIYTRTSQGSIKFENTPKSKTQWTNPGVGTDVDLQTGCSQSGYGILLSGKKVKIQGGSRGQHFSIANRITGRKSDGRNSPANLTWHHQEDKYKMILIDRMAHKKHGHNGGNLLW